MVESLAAMIQALLACSLVYGCVIATRSWRSTVPAGAESDAEFTNHRVTEVTRATLAAAACAEREFFTIASLPSSHAHIDISRPKILRPAHYTGAALGLLLAAAGTGLA
jgi:hypothetical protein